MHACGGRLLDAESALLWTHTQTRHVGSLPLKAAPASNVQRTRLCDSSIGRGTRNNRPVSRVESKPRAPCKAHARIAGHTALLVPVPVPHLRFLASRG